jgi:hypothetical protein
MQIYLLCLVSLILELVLHARASSGCGCRARQGYRESCLWHQVRATHCDVDINTSDTTTPTHNQISDPITRACARQLNNQVSSFLTSYSSYLDNENVYSILLLRNDGQEQNGVAFAPATFGF